MKISRMAMAVAIAGLLSGSQAFAQQYSAYGLQQPAPTQQAAYEYGSYYQEDDAAPPAAPVDDYAPAPAAAAHAGAGCVSCDTGYNSCSTGCCTSTCSNCCLGEAWKLFDFCECNPWTINGWVAQGFTWNPDDPADRFNGPVTFNDRANEYQMNQAYLAIGREVQNDGEGWGFGGQVDLLYGTDYRFTMANGLEVDPSGGNKLSSDANSFYGFAIPQAYATVAYNDLQVKIGHFYTIIGYEVVPATGNFFYSHAYTMQYAEPFTHTGALATFQLNDNWGISGGIVRGWDNWEDNNDDLNFLGGITWTDCCGDRSLAVAVITGDDDDAGDNNRTMYSIVYTHKLYENLQYILQHDLGWEDDGVAAATPGAAAQDAEWYGLNQYLIYTVNDCWSYGLRAEWFRDDDGVRVGGIGNTAGTKRRGWTGGGFAGDFYEVSIGANWKPHANVLVRPELRWDWYDGPAGNGGLQPYDDGTSDDQFLLGTDVIVTY